MTDNEIVKALELCVAGRCGRKCPYSGDDDCQEHNGNDILDLINRQKAEIERLKVYNEKLLAANVGLSCGLLDEIKTARAEAIKEFAERLKAELTTGAAIMRVSVLGIIDDLAKKMTEETA